MVNVLLISGITAIITILGGGIGYFIWLWTRPPKMTWKARVWQVSEGVKPPIIDKRGRVVSDLKLQDLKPYTKDIIEKVDRKPGITIFKLIKLNRTVENVPSNCVDYWGDKEKEVDVLIDQGSCTVLRKGFDTGSGIIFQPIPHDRMNMIISQVAIRKDKLDNKKDILTSLVPWIVVAFSLMALIAVTYFEVQGLLEINEQQTKAMQYSADKMVELERIRKGDLKVPREAGVQDDPPIIEG